MYLIFNNGIFEFHGLLTHVLFTAYSTLQNAMNRRVCILHLKGVKVEGAITLVEAFLY